MKTIEDLNERWWYRLLKVISIFILSVSLLSAFAGVFSEVRPTTETEYLVNCNGGNEKSFVASSEDIYLEGPGEPLYDFQIEDIMDECGVDQGRPFRIDEKEVVRGGWGHVAIFSLVSVAGILALFEFIRRLFYYVALGSFRPKENKNK